MYPSQVEHRTKEILGKEVIVIHKVSRQGAISKNRTFRKKISFRLPGGGDMPGWEKPARAVVQPSYEQITCMI